MLGAKRSSFVEVLDLYVQVDRNLTIYIETWETASREYFIICIVELLMSDVSTTCYDPSLQPPET